MKIPFGKCPVGHDQNSIFLLLDGVLLENHIEFGQVRHKKKPLIESGAAE
jgi:hypothetical protein